MMVMVAGNRVGHQKSSAGAKTTLFKANTQVASANFLRATAGDASWLCGDKVGRCDRQTGRLTHGLIEPVSD